MKKEESIYDVKYGDLPASKEELVSLIQSTMKEKDLEKIQERIKEIENIPWNEMTFIFYLIPKSTPRPRFSNSTGSFYVKNAANNKRMLANHILNNHIIYTRTQFTVNAYLPTPSCSKKDCLLAEMGYIRPLTDPDWDNIGKTYSDMIQGILLTNDNLITDGITRKYYSIKPRVEIILRWQESFDSNFNKRRVTSTKIYKSYFEI